MAPHLHVPRKLRENTEDGLYHVYARGNDRRVIYADHSDRRRYLGLLGQVTRVHRLNCLAYCLMNNHVHLLLETPGANLSSSMQRFHGSYAQAFNRRHGRSGHLFQGRYGAVRISSDAQVCAAAAYIARNPVEAGLCAQPEDWEWSSFAVIANAAEPSWLNADRVLSFFGEEREVAFAGYRLMSQLYEPKGVRPL